MSTPRKYSPAIVQINFDFTSFDKIQNLESIAAGDIELQSDVELINPLVVAQYMLYNRELEEVNFGLDDNVYLGYPGGYLTVGNKVNTKYNPFSILGNFSVYNKTEFFQDISLRNPRVGQTPGSTLEFNSIRNVFQYNNTFINIYGNDNVNSEALSVGDFRRGTHHKGMVMMWSGTYSDLENNLPYWRLCGPPDSGSTVNGVTVPNLIDTFVISSGYTDSQAPDNNRHQPIDNAGRNFGNAINLVVGSTGGFNSLDLTLNQMPVHNHEVELNVVDGGSFSITGKNTPIAIGGGNLINPTSAIAKDRCLRSFSCDNKQTCSNKGNQICGRVDSCDATAGGSCTALKTFYASGTSVISTGISNNAFPTGTLTLNDPAVTWTFSEDDRGSFVNHENRPDFYTLAYIVYVGVKR